MKHCSSRLSFLAGLVCLGVALAPLAKADEWDKRTVITTKAPMEIPGMVLGPGTYVMKLLDHPSNRDIVVFYNQNENHLYKMVFAVKAYRQEVTADPAITFEERANGAPPAIHKSFWPGDHWGEEFVYPKAEQIQTAQVSAPPAPAPAVQPAPPAVAKTQPAPTPQAPVQVAQAAPPPPPSAAQPAPAPAAPPQELPKTASDLPLIGLLGGLAVASGALLRKGRAA